MSVALTATPVTLDRARGALAELAAGREELEDFLAEMFGQLEKLGGELTERHAAAVAQRQAIEQQRRRLADELERERATIEEQRHRLRDQVRREVAEATAEFAEAIVQQRRQMNEERAQWLEELTRMRQLIELLTRRDIKRPNRQ